MSQRHNDLDFEALIEPGKAALLMFYRRAGLTLTQAWTTANVLDTKLELNDKIAKGLKAEALTQFIPSSQNFGAKVNLYFKQPNFHGRAFFDVLKGPTANIDAVLGHEGILVGAEAGYDVNKAAITRYSAAIGYSSPIYSAAITATNNLSVFAASYYHKVNSEVEAGAKATWDSKGANAVGLEVASKYRLDPTSYTKVEGYRLFWRRVADPMSVFLGESERPRCRSSSVQCTPPTGRKSRVWNLCRHTEPQRKRAQGKHAASEIQMKTNWL